MRPVVIFPCLCPISAFTLLVGEQKIIRPVKKLHQLSPLVLFGRS